jgi:hypothetical protein
MGYALVAPAPSFAVNVISPACESTANLPKDQQPAVCQDNNANQTSVNSNNVILGPNGLATKGVEIFVILVGITSVVVMMISGVRLSTAGGNAESAATARRGIIYALAGVVIAVLAQAIVSFVLSRL